MMIAVEFYSRHGKSNALQVQTTLFKISVPVGFAENREALKYILIVTQVSIRMNKDVIKNVYISC